jgi:D-3-phosphoglycerate dehydrogenase
VKPKILFADRRPMSEESLELLRDAGEVVWSEGDEEDEFVRDVKDANVIVSGLRHVTRRVILSAPRLKGVVAYGVGSDHIDVAAATEKQVYVTNTPGVNSISVAEFAFGLMLAIARKIPQLNNTVTVGEWAWLDLIGNELWGKTLGIVGLGKVGTHLANLGKGFGMEILSFTHHPSGDRAEKIGVEFVDLETLLKKADFLVLCCTLNDATRRLIGKRELSLLKPTAYIVNVSRGPIVDENALYKALKDKRIAGAGLDVFEKEPLEPNNPLLNLDNVVLTSHMAGISEESIKRISLTVAEEAIRILTGKEPRYLVNLELSSTRR